jgi:hypothetical protein
VEIVKDNVEKIVELATIRLFFRDGQVVPITNVVDFEDDGITYTITQQNGDYFSVPIEDNVKLVEVSYV